MSARSYSAKLSISRRAGSSLSVPSPAALTTRAPRFATNRSMSATHHLTQIFNKTDVSSRFELALLATQRRIVDTAEREG